MSKNSFKQGQIDRRIPVENIIKDKKKEVVSIEPLKKEGKKKNLSK